MKVFKSLYGHRLVLPVQNSLQLNKIITIYFRVNINHVGAEAFELGLLVRNKNMSVDGEEDTDNFCFVHSKFQKFAAAEFISKQSKVKYTFFFATDKIHLNGYCNSS